jgi:hypothetical protein
MSVFYESDILSQVFRYFVDQATQDRTLLQLSREFHRLNLAEDAVKLAPRIAPHFLRLLKPTKDAPLFTFSELYDSVSPKLFAAILDHPLLKIEARQILTPDRLVGLTDEYVGTRVFSDPEDCEALASVVSWTESDSFLHLVRHKCDWLPSKYSKPLFSEILSRRMRTLGWLLNDAQKSAPIVSRWYAFAWLSTIRDARSARNSPTVSIVEFISTLGGLTRPFNPRPFGLVNVFQSVEALAPEFESDGLFDTTKYFMAMPQGNKKTLVGLDFGRETRFRIERLRINTECPIRMTVPRAARSRKPVAVAAVFKIADNVEGCLGNGEGCEEQAIRFKEGKYEEVFNIERNGSVVAVEFTEPNSKGFRIARLYELNFDGYFSNQ